MTTYHQAYLTRGGGEYELFELARRLNELGCTADIYGPYSRNITEYDIVLHFSVHGGGLELFNEVIKYGKQIVLWPNYWPDLNIELSGIKSMVDWYANNANLLVFKSRTEEDIFLKNFNVKNPNTYIARTPIDEHLVENFPKRLFEKLYGIKNYALSIGLIEPTKNQLQAIEATKKLGITLVIVGRYRNKEYYDECKKIGCNTVFIDSLPAKSEILRSAIKEAEFFIELSNQPPGISALDAAFLGSKMVLGDSLWSREHFQEHAFYCDPGDSISVCSAIQRAIESNKDIKIKLAAKMKKYAEQNDLENFLKLLKTYN